MSSFEAVKDLSMSDVAPFYGVDLNRHGKGLCPFHADSTPSLSVKGNRWRCFVCSSAGDAVDLVATLHKISPLDALKQLNRDFGLGLNFEIKVDIEAVKKRRAEAQLVNNFNDWEAWAFRVICRHFHILRNAVKTLAPSFPEAEPDSAWVAAIHEFSRAEYWLDILTTGCFDSRLEFYTMHWMGVAAIAKTQNEISKNSRAAS